MRNRYSATLLAAALASTSLWGCTSARIAAAPAVSAEAEEQALRARVGKLLASYQANDPAGVIAMLDPVKFTIWGSDLAEIADTPEELRALMESDFRLWITATFTDLRDFDWRTDGHLATANFVVSFSASGGPAIPIRLATTWRKVEGEWRLTQAVSSVPTLGGR